MDAAATVDTARRALARSLLAAGELSEAASLLELLSAADREARRLRGELQARRGDHVAAVQLLEPLVSADPTDVEARVWLGRSLFHVGRLDDADRQFEWLASNRPNRPEGFYWRGIVQLRRLNADKAVPLFDQTVAVDPAFGPAWEASAVALASIGKIGETLQRLEEAARLSPQRAEIPFAQAVCLARVNQREASPHCAERWRWTRRSPGARGPHPRSSACCETRTGGPLPPARDAPRGTSRVAAASGNHGRMMPPPATDRTSQTAGVMPSGR